MSLKRGVAIVHAAFVALLLWSPGVHAQGLTREELSYLEEEFGTCLKSPTLNLLTPQERARLHDIFVFDKEWSRAYPYIFNVRLFGVLDTANIRQCQEWSREHSGSPCPPLADPAHQAGKNIADFQCNACHLFGTPDAPGFFRLARAGNTSVEFLSQSLASGHQMSPIHLTTEELSALSHYIASLTCGAKSSLNPTR